MRENSFKQIIFTSIITRVLQRSSHGHKHDQRNYRSLHTLLLLNNKQLLQSQNGHRSVRYLFSSPSIFKSQSKQCNNYDSYLSPQSTAPQRQLPSSQRLFILNGSKSTQNHAFLTYWKINCQIFQRHFHTFQCRRYFSAVLKAVELRGDKYSRVFCNKVNGRTNKQSQSYFFRSHFLQTPAMMVWVSDYDKPKVT